MSWRYKQFEQEKMGAVLSFYPLVAPFKSLSLRKSPLNTILTRHTSPKVSIDELYHENSKLSPSGTDLESLLGFYKSVAAEAHRLEKGTVEAVEGFGASEGLFQALDSLPEPRRQLLQGISKDLPFFLGYYCIVMEEQLTSIYRFIRPHYLLTIKEGDLKTRETLEGSVYFSDGKEKRLKDGSIALLLYGNHILARAAFDMRGYRVLLLECGRWIESIERTLERQGISVASSALFCDNVVNVLLGIDGRGFSVHAILFLGAETL